ncbi:MAG TPA: hypothetical protein VFZ57_08195, partial [Thermoanaerobaculia bacterium]|nr:hypothetical protein [Thermoanaerobaculia bacterium]
NAVWDQPASTPPWTSPSSKVLIDLSARAGGPQPIYYSPASNGIGTSGYQVFVMASGSFYEASPAVSGWNVNRTGNPPALSGFPDSLPVFVPTLFIATNPFKITDTTNFAATPLGSGGSPDMSAFLIQRIVGGESAGIALDPTDPTFSAGVHEHLGTHSQLTSSPLLILDTTTGQHQVFFSVYDPDFGCHGFSYVVVVKFTIAAGCGEPSFSPNPAGCAGTKTCGTTVYAAGPGASSGFVATEKGAFGAQTALGSGDARLTRFDRAPPVPPGAPFFVPLWWKEQK